MAGGIPTGAVGVSVGVLLYSVLCLTLSVLLVCLLWSYGERWTYVTLLTIFTSISTLGSIAQQIHYATRWEEVKQAQYDKAIASLSKPALAFGGAAQSVDVVLYWIQFYCYNVMSLMVLFWTMALFRASWGLQIAWLGDWRMRMELISKVFGVLFPALIIGLSNTDAIINVPALDFIVMNILMFFNLTAGSVLLVLILSKYLKTRRLTARNSERSPWWASNQKSTGSRSEGTVTNETIATNDSAPISARQSIYDRALVTRFTIGFVILAVFELAIIMFALFQSSNNNNIALSGGPDHSVSGTTIDIVLFIPGVSASLVVFLVFGTTKSWRQYWNMIAGGCGARTKLQERSLRRRTNYPPQRENEIHLEDFERLPSRTSGPDDVSKGGFVLPPQRPITELTFDRMELPADINLRLGSADSSDDDSINRLPIQSPDGSIHPRNYSRSNTIRTLPV